MPLSVYIQVLLATFLWGTAIPVGKTALSYVPPLTLAGLRFTLAGLFLLAASSVWGGGRGEALAGPESRRSAGWPRVMLIALLSTASFYGLFFLGMNRTSASSAAVVDGTGPIISSVLAHFILRGDRLTPRRLLAILIAFSGVAVIALFRSRGGHAQSTVDPFGCLLILMGMFVGNLGTMFVITYRGRLGLMRLTGLQMFLGGLVLLMAAWLTERGRWEPGIIRRQDFAILWLWLSTVSAVAFCLWYGLVRRYKVTALSVFSFMTAVWGAVLSVIFLNDRLTPQLTIGMGLVVTGVLVMNTDRTEHRREIPPETEP